MTCNLILALVLTNHIENQIIIQVTSTKVPIILQPYIPSDNSRVNNTEEKRRGKRKTIWFNPSHSMNLRNNIGKTFLKLMRKHFPNGNSLHKTSNKNTLKISCSCMASIISPYNCTILNSDVSLEYGCKCISKNECSLSRFSSVLTLKAT